MRYQFQGQRDKVLTNIDIQMGIFKMQYTDRGITREVVTKTIFLVSKPNYTWKNYYSLGAELGLVHISSLTVAKISAALNVEMMMLGFLCGGTFRSSFLMMNKS